MLGLELIYVGKRDPWRSDSEPKKDTPQFTLMVSCEVFVYFEYIEGHFLRHNCYNRAT